MDDNILNLSGLDNIFNENEIDQKKKQEIDDDLFKDTRVENEYKSELDSILDEVDKLASDDNTNSHNNADAFDDNDYDLKINDNDLSNKTIEDKKGKLIGDLFETMNISSGDSSSDHSSGGDNSHHSSSMNFTKDIEDDEKINMITEITLLRDDLSQMGVSLEHIHDVDHNSSYTEIRQILTILRTMIKRHKYSTFAEELITTGATFLEELFDGKKTYFGRFSPDLTGWHKEVRQKLYRSRDHTSQFINDTIASYDIHPLLRLAFELIPSAILYSHSRKASSKKTSSSSSSGSNISAYKNLSEL